MALVINGEMVDDSVIREEARVLRPHYQEMAQGMDPIEMEMQLRDWSRENVIERVLLRQEALRDPEPISPELIERTLQEMKAPSDGQPRCRTGANDDELRKEVDTRIRIDRLLHKITSKVSPPKPKEVSEYYRKNKERFWTGDLVRASHIVRNVDENTTEEAALQVMQKVREELSAGATFEQLADRYSDCPGNGGDLGYFPRGQMVPEFDEVVFSLKVNQISDVFRSVFGFHIAKVYDRRPAGTRSFTEVQDEIAQTLHREKQERALETFVDELRAKADIQDTRRKGVPVVG